MIATDPVLAFAGVPTIPVRVWEEEGHWRKQPLTEWDRATTDEDQITAWGRKWPDARPGVPLAAVGWCAVDVDDPECAAFWEVWDALGPRGPYSKVRTVSGGCHFVFAQPPEPISKMQWCEGVEILGTSCLLTIHDIDAILFPRVAPRAVLPKVFWKPLVRQQENPIKNHPSIAAPVRAGAVAGATAALWQMNPRDWGKRWVGKGRRKRWVGDYAGWSALMLGAKFVGISGREWVRWCVSNPHYARDERRIARMWERCEPTHGGAFYAACAARGIRLRKEGPVFNGALPLPLATPSPPATPSSLPTKPFPNINRRTDGLLCWLGRNATADNLFNAACLMAEMGLTEATTTRLVDGNLPGLRRELADVEFTYQITRAYAWVAAKERPQ
jgi:hypothetical protein